MNKILIVLAAVALGAGIYWYSMQVPTASIENQDFSSSTTQTQGLAQKQKPTPMPTPTKPQVALAPVTQAAPAYALPEIGISVGTVNSWNCQKQQTHAGHPNWIQITCYAGQVGMGDPHMALNNAPVDNSETLSIVSTQNVAIDGRIAEETVYRSHNTSSDNGVVEYLFTDATPEKSFAVIFPYGTGKPHISAAAAAAVGRTIVESITFN